MSDLPVELWLDLQQQNSQHTVIPYVRSAESLQLHYKISMVRHSLAGVSHIQQAGDIQVVANQATPLATLSATGGTEERCQLLIDLKAPPHPVLHYRFDCPQLEALLASYEQFLAARPCLVKTLIT